MPKFKIVCVLLAAVLAATGTVLVVKNLVGGGGEIPFFEKPTEDPNTYIELTDDVDINDADTDVRTFLFIAHKVLLDGEGFYGVALGATTAAGIKQNVRNSRYVIGEFDNKHVLKEMVTSGVTKNAYQLYMTGSNYIYRDKERITSLEDVTWSNTAQPLTEDVFYNRFGHRNDKLTGYILNWDTVLKGELTGVKDGIYTFRYVLENETATKYLRREMITNGGLVDEPTFSKCEIYVAMDANFNIKSLRTDCAYKADLGFISANCTEDITEVIEPYSGELPYADFYKDYLNKEGGDIDKEMGALDVLLAMFAPYLNGEDLQVALSASNKGKEMFSALLSVSGLDISDLTKLQVAAQIGDINVSYVNSESSIYLKYQDFQGSTTVDGILGLVDTMTSLMGDGAETVAMDSSLLGDFDAESLLDNLTFTLFDDDTKCVVNLPVSIAGLNINANLYADVDGETYTFTHATVTVGDIQLTIEPQTWKVAEINKNEYPEILGLADLIQNGKLALTANIGLTLDGNDYTVAADVLVDLATANLKVTATLDKYGTVSATLVDGVAYVAIGGIKVKLDTANIEQLLEQIQSLLGDISIDMPAPVSTLSANSLLASFGGITATKEGDGRVTFKLSFGNVKAALYLKSVNNRWQLDTVTISTDGFYANVTPSDKLDDVTAPKDAAKYADISELIDTFVDPIFSIIDAKGFEIGFDGSVKLDGKTYAVNATLKMNGGNVHVIFTLSYNGVKMFDDVELWLVDGRLYIDAGDFKFAMELDRVESDNGSFDLDSLKETLQKVKGYNGYVDNVVELVLSLLDTQLDNIKYDEIVRDMSFENGKLSLTIDGSQFGLSVFTFGLSANNGLILSLESFSYKNITLNITKASIAAYDGHIDGPGVDEDFSTNLEIDVQEYDSANNVSGEHNVIYVNIDLLKGVVLGRIKTTMKDGDTSFLDIKYTFADNVLRLTNGEGLNVLVNINNIADIVDRINDIVNEFAGAGDKALPDLFGSLGGDLDIKQIINSLTIGSASGEVKVGVCAMGFNITAVFKNGLKSVTVPVDLIESNLVVKPSSKKEAYSNFSDDDSKYVSIDKVFNDYYYGEDGEESANNGPIYKLVHTNSWKFDFRTDSEIDVKNDDGTTTKYQIIHGSYIAFYYNKTDAQNFKIRADLTVQKDGNEFLYLDVALIDGRIYATYDSRKNDGNTNELKATVSLDAIKETIDLLPALTKVIPQIGTLMNSMQDAMSNAESKLTLGNVSKILHSVSYETEDNKNVFTLEINGQAIDAVNFGKAPITLKVSNFGDEGLSLDELSLSYGSVSVNLVDLVVTGSPKNEETDEFEYVEKYINSYFAERGQGVATGEAAEDGYDAAHDHGYNMTNHMNIDSIYELLSALAITAGNFDADNQRSFLVEGDINASMNVFLLGDLIDLTIHVTMYADIDVYGNSYFAVKLERQRTQAKIALSKYDVYDDHGGNSYLLFNSVSKRFTVVRDSLQERTWCTECTSYTCTGGKNWLGLYNHRNSFKTGDVYDSMYNSGVYYTPVAPYEGGEPSKKYDNITLTQLLANINTTDGESPVFEMLNLGTIDLLVYKVDLEQTIREAIGQPNDNVYGVEDILKSYSYTRNTNDGGTFAVVADMSPVNEVLGQLQLNILHSGNFDDLYYDERGILRGVSLTDITGQFDLFENSSLLNMTITINLHHSTPATYGTAENYVLSQNYIW